MRDEIEKYFGFLCEAEKNLKLAESLCVRVPCSRLSGLLRSIGEEYRMALRVAKSLRVGKDQKIIVLSE